MERINHMLMKFSKAFLITGVVLLSVSFPVTAQEEPEEDNSLPLVTDMARPSDEEFLNGPKRDWIVLANDQVLVVEPLQPRPDVLEQIQYELDELIKIRPSSGRDLEQWREEYDQAQFFRLRILNDRESQLYEIHRRYIKEILHHEDMMILRLNELINSGQYDLAREFYYRLSRWDEQRILKRKENSIPSSRWPLLPEIEVKFKLEEATLLTKKGQQEKAWRILQTIDTEVADQNDLFSVVRFVGQALLNHGLKNNLPEYSRLFYKQLRQEFSRHPQIPEWRNQLKDKALQLVQESQQANLDPFEKDALLRYAVRWDSGQRTVRDGFNKHFREFPIINIGLLTEDRLDESHPQGHSFRSIERSRQLNPQTLFQLTSYRQGHPNYVPRLIKDWEPLDLGRQMSFLLTTDTPEFSGYTVESHLVKQLNPNSSQSDDRLRRELKEWQLVSPYEMNLKLRGTPLRLEPLLEPIGMVATPSTTEFPDGLTGPLPNQGFAMHKQSQADPIPPNSVAVDRWIRRDLSKQKSGRRSVCGIRECYYDSEQEMLRDFLRGQLDLLPYPNRTWLPEMKDDKRFQQVKMSIPEVHLLQPHPESKVMAEPLVRKALCLALNRQQIMEDCFVSPQTRHLARLTSGPFPQSSYAYDPSIEPTEFNFVSGIAMLTAWQAMKKTPIQQLRIRQPIERQARKACQSVAKQLSRLGIPVELVEHDATEWELSYRIIQMAEPLTEMWSLLSLSHHHRVADLAHLPDIVRQRLQSIEEHRQWSDASAELRRLHHDLHDLMLLIPLWELDRVALYRSDLGPMVSEQMAPVSPYQAIDRWTPEAVLPEVEPIR